MDITYEAMMRGIDAIKPGATLGDLGHAIQSYAEAERTSVVREFCGHGLGKVFHDAPNILHFGKPGQGEVLKPGMIFTVEPMLNARLARGEGAGRWLDGGDEGQVAVGAIRALGRRHGRRASRFSRKSPAGLDQPHALKRVERAMAGRSGKSRDAIAPPRVEDSELFPFKLSMTSTPPISRLPRPIRRRSTRPAALPRSSRALARDASMTPAPRACRL